MSVIDDLKPTRKALVMDLLSDAGFDVSDWKNYRGRAPAANPKYCYNWSFEQPGEAVAVCLWHDSLTERDGKIVYHRKPKAGAYKRDKSAVWNLRNSEFDARLELALRQQLAVRVIVLEVKQANKPPRKTNASIVAGRSLDATPWAVTEYDYDTGECWLVRGERPTTPAVDAPDLEGSWFEGKERRDFVFHRQREARARREKIRECLAKNGGRLVCEVPNCGFDFVERYGPLGEGYAQVHHLLPLSSSPPEGRKTGLKDLAIVCANCHVMIHIGGKCRPLAGLVSRLA
jgi:5-methylcytosine-specific restriction enzyme A